MIEEWRDIEGYPNYQVSNLGRVKSLPRWITIGHGKTFTKEKILKGSFSGNRGLGWTVSPKGTDGKFKQIPVARLMLTAFVRPPNEGEVARHLDDNKYNQSLENLAWGYPKDNTHDALKNGKMHVGSKCSWSKLCESQVLEIRKNFVSRCPVNGAKALSEKYNVDYTLIYMILKREIWKHI